MNEIVVDVVCRYGTYTARLGRTRASCTTGERQAVRRLAEKLYGKEQRPHLEFHVALGIGKTQWLIRCDDAPLRRGECA